ncbi:HAD family hydrolase [Alterisphingorhabdus coralli]|uniref:HAD family phosphatase n=1 Tax=Alterisphingorhabdus coralli TaxID=3071408 RepID=A0AA97I0K5_9SPHN|nr:HAD family phosphatase [Parasphingorhabdus sp. SCSIO 66989]WOE75769.1 HAD family phosphatase [Parasphingorhabdus sp. SCSIO 66989]
MTEISNVIFDVGNVLYQWDIRALYGKLIDDPERLDWFLDNVVTLEWHFQHDAGRELAPMVAELVAEWPEERELIEAYVPRWLETIPGPVPGSLALVEELHAREVPIFGITNFGVEFWAMFRPTAPIFDLFGDIIVSGAEKMMKPDPRIYQLAQRRFKVDPSATLFIDDRQDNVDSARACGFVGHQFQNADALRAELESHDLLGRR